MKPTNLTVFELFEKERRYIIPLFQRPYVWTQDKQWEPLWEDISAKAVEILDQSSLDYQSSNHFLGATVLNQIKTFGRQVAAMEVIDGQQRLTTLQILLLTLRDFIKAVKYESLDSTLSRLTKNDCRLDQPFEQYKVWPTTADRSIFEKLYTAGSPDNVNILYPLQKIKYSPKYHPRPNLVEAYLYFYDALSDFVYDANDNGVRDSDETIVIHDRLEALIEAITKRLELVVIELEERDNPQIIFETLNARGEPLLPSDLIRNFVFLDANRRHEDVERLYNIYWSDYDESSKSADFWKTLEQQGRLSRPRIDLFLFHYLTSQAEHEIPITHLFSEFRNWWNGKAKSDTSVETGLNNLQFHSNVYKEFFTQNIETRLGVFVNRLRIMDTSTVYPLLLFLFGEKRHLINDDEQQGIITDLESYLIRRMICGFTTKNYNRIFLTLLRNLRAGEQINRQQVQKLLLESQAEAVRWPTDQEFQHAWLTKPVYDTLKNRRVKMILTALDLQLETKRQEQIHITGDLSIEHIWPQNPSQEDWTPMSLEYLIHTFGNLTLLTQPLNSSISNGAFSVKRPEIAKQSRLRLNVYFQDFSDTDKWTEERIAERGNSMFELAKNIWPRPHIDSV